MKLRARVYVTWNARSPASTGCCRASSSCSGPIGALRTLSEDSIVSWFQQIFSRRRLYSDLSEELRGHLEERTEQIMRTQNVTREEAERAARKAFGNPSLMEERSKEAWQWPRIEILLRDLSFSTRLLRKSPGFTMIAILTITLGVGANTAVFSLLNGLLLRPLPVPEAHRLVMLRMQPSD